MYDDMQYFGRLDVSNGVRLHFAWFLFYYVNDIYFYMLSEVAFVWLCLYKQVWEPKLTKDDSFTVPVN